jgi:hypothetical protein
VSGAGSGGCGGCPGGGGEGGQGGGGSIALAIYRSQVTIEASELLATFGGYGGDGGRGAQGLWGGVNGSGINGGCAGGSGGNGGNGGAGGAGAGGISVGFVWSGTMPLIDDATLTNIFHAGAAQGGTRWGSSPDRAPDGVAQDVYQTM